MTNNFNPGFDREKASFLELANRGDGLTPIEYIYAGNASFESVLASHLKGGMIEINMLYVTNIDASDIITVTLEADIGTITTIYSENIYNKEKITTKDLFVSDNIYFGTDSKGSKTLIYGSVEAHSGPWSITTTTMEIKSGATEFALGAFSLDAGVTTMATGASAWTAGSLSINSTLVSINYIEGALKVGAVGIYSGGLMDINAPKIQIGDPTKLGVTTLTISMKPDISFTCSSATVNVTGSTIINLTSEADINLKSPTLDLAAEIIEVGGVTDVDYTTIFAVRANKFFITTQSLATMEIRDTGIGTNFSLDGIDLCDISTNNIVMNSTAAVKINAANINITGVTSFEGTVEITGDTTVNGATQVVGNLDVVGSIEFGTITFKDGGVGIYTWPSPPILIPVPLIEMNYLDCESETGILVWKTQLLETIVEIPQTIQYLACEAGILSWMTRALPLSELIPVGTFEVVTITNHLSCISLTGELAWMTSVIKVIGTMPVSNNKKDKLEIGKNINIKGNDLKIPSFDF